MRHKKYETLMVLSFYDEISSPEEDVLNKHLESCERCRDFKRSIARVLPERKPFDPPENERELAAARLATRRSLSVAGNASLGKQKVVKFASAYSGRPAMVPAYAAISAGFVMLILGIISGSFFLGQRSSGNELQSILKEISSKNSENTAIGDVRFGSTDQKSGEVQFSFDLVRRYEMKGSLEDQGVQKILAYALVNSDNPGVRLRTVGILGASASVSPDNEIRDALVKALKEDENTGVRREALLSLAKLPFDNTIKDALLYVLQHDKNPGMRVAAINTLSREEFASRTRSTEERSIIDPRTLEVLRERSASDQNRYVRLKAADMLKEYKEL